MMRARTMTLLSSQQWARLACSHGTDEAARKAVRHAWHVQRALLKPALEVARCNDTDKAARAALKITIDDARLAFKPRLYQALDDGRAGTTHVLMVALGDLERYYEIWVDPKCTDRKAETLYVRALRLRPEHGLCAGNIGALEMVRKRWGAAVHWYLRASLASEP